MNLDTNSWTITGNGVQQAMAPVINSQTFQDMIYNASLTRSEFLRKFLDPRRDIAKECGYPDTEDIKIEDYADLFDRNPIANRVVNLLPSESWTEVPSVYESEDPEDVTEFEEAWDALSTQLFGESWYEDEEESEIWSVLYEADILSGVGRYGVIFFGLNDKTPLEQPVEGFEEYKKGKTSPTKRTLNFIRVFDEIDAQVASVVSDENDPRYGQPLFYNINFNSSRSQEIGFMPSQGGTKTVHYTRVLHICDTLSRRVLAIPRLRPVLNPTMDLIKLYGGSAEMYWQGAFPGISIETNPQLGPRVQIDKVDMRNQMENYMNGLQRYLALSGLQAKTLSPTVVDPTAQIKIHLEAIAIKLECPMRIFMGSERGELASGQDQGSWDMKTKRRRKRYIIPRLIVPFVNTLIKYGVLPEPENFHVEYPSDEPGLTETEKTTNAKGRIETVTAYLSGGVEKIMTPIDFLTEELGYEHEKAVQMLDAANKEQEKAQEKAQEEQAALAEQQAVKAPPTVPGDGSGPPAAPGKVSGGTPVENQYNPNQPRDSHGKWGGGGGGSIKSGGKQETLFEVSKNSETKQWVGKDGKPAPEHIQKIGVPPAWKDVYVNPDPDGTVMARGIDAKGRVQTKYSDNHTAQASQKKFARTTELREKRAGIFKELEQDAKKPELRDQADCLKVVMQTGMRPGGGSDTKADYESFGATTLQGRHVIANTDGTATLRLVTGKNKGREVEFPIKDKATAEMLLARASEKGADKPLFNVSATKLRDYSRSKDGGGFKTKDHRTALGTETAIAKIKELEPPKTKKEFKTKTKEVATAVSDVLGNTPAVAMSSYIDPVVFSAWNQEGLK